MTVLPTSNEIKQYFPFIHKALVNIFIALLFIIIHKSTVNLNKAKKSLGLALGIKGLSLDAAYKRLIRFFKMSHVACFCIGVSYLMFSLLNPMEAIYLALDRTNWQIGKENKVNINVLVIGLVLSNGCFIPIVWQQLEKRGNSSEVERNTLLNLFVELFIARLPQHFEDKRFIMLGDREFIGKKWFEELSKYMQFIMRVRRGDYLLSLAQSWDTTIDKALRKIERLCKRDGFVYQAISIDGRDYYYVVVPNTKKGVKKSDMWVRFVSNIADLQTIRKTYQQRWQIEVFFKHCKTNGFNLEDMNVTQTNKVMLMVAIVGCAYVLAIREGILENEKRPIKMQWYAKQGKAYKRKSIFTLGYEQLETHIFDLNDLIQRIKDGLSNQSIPDYSIIIKYFMKEAKFSIVRG